MERIPYEFDPSVKTKLGEIYLGPHEALGTQIANALLAVEFAFRKKPDLYGEERPRISIVLHPTEGMIEVIDPGVGITEHQYRGWVKNLGLSQWEEGETRGEGDRLRELAHGKGIGLLSFAQIVEGKDNRLSVYSIALVDGRAHRLIMSRGGEYEKKAGFEEIDKDGLKRKINWPHGTVVSTEGIPKGHFKGNGVFTFDRLFSWLTREVGPALREIPVDLVLTKGARTEFVLPPKPEGEEIEVSPALVQVDGQSAFVEFLLAVAPPETKGRVGVLDADHRLVIKDITSYSGLDCSPWNKGELNGWITADFVPQESNRSQLDTSSEAFRIWQKAVNSRRQVVEEQIASIFASRQKRDRADFVRDMNKLASEVLNRVGIRLTQAVGRAKERGEEEKTERKKRQGKTQPSVSPRPDQRTCPQPSLQFVWHEEKDWDHEPIRHTFFFPASQLLHVNVSHSDYQRAEKEGEKAFRHYALLITLEAALREQCKQEPERIPSYLVSCTEELARLKGKGV